ncbi:MAG: hypothetical protein CFE46_17215 [Burkholderiales bacterium PBB6]|nr:MAG: hypothetical protein CFE46_17215 [Burkholderiales bacterium PBB6]
MMATTLARWARLIDGLSLRERAFLFASLAMLLLAVADQLVISPSLRQQGEWRQTGIAGSAELAAMSKELDGLSRDAGHAGTDPQLQALIQSVERARAERAELLLMLQGGRDEAVPAVALPKLLATVLQRHARVSLVRLESGATGANSGANSAAGRAAAPGLTAASAAMQSLASAPGGTPANPAPAAANETRPGDWQGAKLTISGQYADLQQFLAELERTLPGLRWGTLSLQREQGQPLLSVQLWLAGSAP